MRHQIVSFLAQLAGKTFLRSVGRCAYRSLRRLFFSMNSVAPGGVIFTGDSLIDQWTSLTTDFPYLEAVNRGISGDISTQLLRRFNDDILMYQPSAIVILIGTNDLVDGVSSARVAACLCKILALIASSRPGIPVVICHITPRTPELGKFPEKIRNLNFRIDRLALQRSHVSTCDTFSPLATASGGCRDDCFVDGLHLSPKGYKVLAATLKEHFEKFPPLPATAAM